MSIQHLPGQGVVRTYIALPISETCPGRKDLTTLIEDSSRTWSQLGQDVNFKANATDPCLFVGSFLAKDKPNAIAMAKKIQEDVRRKFFKLPEVVTKAGVPQHSLVRYAEILPNSATRDFCICQVDLKGTFLKSLAKIIEVNGSRMDGVSQRVEGEGRKKSSDDSPFLIMGEIQTAGIKNEDLLRIPIEPLERELPPLNADPKNLLFFTHDKKSPASCPLDLNPPFSFPQQTLFDMRFLHNQPGSPPKKGEPEPALSPPTPVVREIDLYDDEV